LKQSQRIVKNFFASGLSTGLGGFLQLVVILVVARWLTVREFGVFSFMLAFGFVVERLCDCGMSSILIRDLAVAPARIGELLGAALALMIPIGLVLLLAMTGIIPLFRFNRHLSILIGLMGIARFEHVITGCYGAVLLSQEAYELHAIGFVMHKLGLLLMVSGALSLGTGLTGVVVAHLVSIVLPWALFRRMVAIRYGHARLNFQLRLWKYLITQGAPVGAAAVVRLLGEQSDVMILTAMAGTQAVGFFSGPYRIGTGLRYLPQALVVALFPMFSRSAAAIGSTAEFLTAYERGLRLFILMAFPPAVVFLVAPQTMTVSLLGARYLAATPAMRLMSPCVLLLFFASPFPLLLTALNQQRFLLGSSLIALILRIGLVLALTPSMNFLAPCIALIVAETVLVTMWIGGVRQAGLRPRLINMAWRPAIGAATMAALLYWLAPHTAMGLIAASIAGSAVYLAVVLKLGALSEAEVSLIREGLNFVRPFLAEWSHPLHRKSP